MLTIALCTVAGYVIACEGWSNKKALAADNFEEKRTIKITTTTNKQNEKQQAGKKERKKKQTTTTRTTKPPHTLNTTHI